VARSAYILDGVSPKRSEPRFGGNACSLLLFFIAIVALVERISISCGILQGKLRWGENVDYAKILLSVKIVLAWQIPDRTINLST